MALNPAFDLSNLRAGIRSMYASADREAARIRGAHLGEVSRLTPHAMAANVGSAMLVLWTLGDQRSPGLWAWWAALMLISFVALLGWQRNRRRRFDTASIRAVHRATTHAALLAGVWAVLPLTWFAGLAPTQQLVIATLFTGMLSAGTFMLSPLPLASLAYAAIYTVSSTGALLLAREPAYLAVVALVGFYAAMTVVGSLAMWRKATALLLSQAQAVRQEQMLAVLLHDFEQHAGDALWETNVEGHLNHVSPRLSDLLGVSVAEARRQPLLALLMERCSDGVTALQRALDAGRPFRELMLQRRDGDSTRHLSINGKRLADDTGRTLGWRGVLADITARVEAERSLWQLAHTDSLTGLANRFTLREALAQVQRD